MNHHPGLIKGEIRRGKSLKWGKKNKGHGEKNNRGARGDRKAEVWRGKKTRVGGGGRKTRGEDREKGKLKLGMRFRGFGRGSGEERKTRRGKHLS